jgi:phosphatidylglycerol:prolipoprotein diacylglycerol transferase
VAARTGAQPSSTDAAEPEALAATFSFDPGGEGEPYDAVVRLTGRRVGVTGTPRASDSFSQDETIEGVIPGTGPVSVTAWVYGLRPGEWTVDARLIRGPRTSGTVGGMRAGTSLPVDRASWSWRRWALSPVPSGPIKTRWALLAPLARQPAVIPGIYSALAVIGFILALAVQAAILTSQGVDFGSPLFASLIALGAGLGGAKVWYKVLNPDKAWFVGGGWAVDGFLVVFPLVGAITLYSWDLPVGRVFDATTPGIFFAVAIGRVGCFFTGCCAGRCTASRWGIWSSDRRVGARRVPTQLLEAAAGLGLGVVTLVIVLAGGLLLPGAVFVVAFAMYAAVRQVLLRLRTERRRSPRTVPLTAFAAGGVAIVVAAIALAQGG